MTKGEYMEEVVRWQRGSGQRSDRGRSGVVINHGGIPDTRLLSGVVILGYPPFVKGRYQPRWDTRLCQGSLSWDIDTHLLSLAWDTWLLSLSWDTHLSLSTTLGFQPSPLPLQQVLALFFSLQVKIRRQVDLFQPHFWWSTTVGYKPKVLMNLDLEAWHGVNPPDVVSWFGTWLFISTTERCS